MPVVVWYYQSSTALSVGVLLSPMSSWGWWRALSLHPHLPQPHKEGTDRPVRASPLGTCTCQAALLLACKTWAEHTQTWPLSLWWAPAPGSPTRSTAPLVQLCAGKILEKGGQHFPHITAGEAVPRHCLPPGRKNLLATGFSWRWSSTSSSLSCPEFNWNCAQSRLWPSKRNEVCQILPTQVLSGDFSYRETKSTDSQRSSADVPGRQKRLSAVFCCEW